MRGEHSRALLLAQHATGRTQSELERRLGASIVVVSVDPSMPASALTARVALTTLRRGPGELVLLRDGLSAASVEQLEAAVAAIDPDHPLRVGARPGQEPTALLHLGPSAGSGAIRIVPDGYGAHLAGMHSAVIRPARPGTALGAIYAAALGAAEVFKHTAGILPARRVLHCHLRFSPVMLSQDLRAAPTLAEPLAFDLALIGVGAIGTGVALILGALGAQGTLLAVDPQRFAPENRGTYSLGGADDIKAAPWKADLARGALSGFDVVPYCKPVDTLPAAIDSGELPWFPLALTGLDSPEARRDAQRLWPDRLIDGATGDTMVGLHDYGHAYDPCMICVFPVRRDGPSAIDRVAELTGLPADLLGQGDQLLAEEHLAGLTHQQRRLLKPHVGKPVCGLAKAAGLTGIEAAGFMPAVPFISLQAACLMVGRLLAHRLGMDPPANLVQYDGLFGPQAATLERMTPRPDCYCQTRAKTIATIRTKRRQEMSSTL